jgi:hypothetical protein
MRSDSEIRKGGNFAGRRPELQALGTRSWAERCADWAKTIVASSEEGAIRSAQDRMALKLAFYAAPYWTLCCVEVTD